MPKPFLHRDDEALERDAIETMRAGLKQWRPDLEYPESHSDLQACFRALLTVYDIKRRPLPKPLRIRCCDCEGVGNLISLEPGLRRLTRCLSCEGRGWNPSEG